jgi:hypothetical protein
MVWGYVGTPIPQKRNRGQILGIVGDFMSRYLFDTREKRNEHIKAYFDKHGIEYEIRKLDVGDYQIEGKPQISVDRKRNLQELSKNLMNAKDHSRFWKVASWTWFTDRQAELECPHHPGIGRHRFRLLVHYGSNGRPRSMRIH